MTPKQVYERQLHLALTGDRVAQLELYALDAVVEAPFAGAVRPSLLPAKVVLCPSRSS